MNKLQKIAFINLCLAGLGLIFMLLKIFAGERIVRAVAIIASMVVLLLMVITNTVRMINYYKGGPHFDERDKTILKTASLIGLFIAFIVAFLSILLSLMAAGFDASITIGNLNTMFLFVMMFFFISESLAVLIQYGCGEKDGK